jgi:hypothetical protein
MGTPPKFAVILMFFRVFMAFAEPIFLPVSASGVSACISMKIQVAKCGWYLRIS